MPRGVLVVVAVGLIACVLAALLATDKGSGEAADLEWVQSAPMADSKPVEVPGGGGTMQLVDGGIRSTGTNSAGFALYRSLAVLEVSAGSPVGSARINCSMVAPAGTEVAQTHNHRASYPRSSEELYEQEVPEVLLLDFSSHGDELAVVEVTDLPERLATERGINLEWPEYKLRHEGWEYFLPPGSRRKTWFSPSSRPGSRPRSPHQGLLHADDQRRRGHRPDPGLAARTLRTDCRIGSAGVGGSDQQLRPLFRSFADFVQLRVGGGALHPAAVERAAHRHRVLGAQVGAQPGRLGLGVGQDHRHPVVDRGDDLVRRRGHDRAAVEPTVLHPALIVVLPLLAGAEAGEGKRLATVDGEAPGLARLLGILGPHPLVEAVGDDQAAVAELADQRP